ncbi:anthrone oxygenase family protein [Streptomyces sp. NPDC020755]|uniref:anthrone oxygenase family protein n=1 Tax=Streptomyces sp. NPDC020755 TaxID=3154790 RepID=UPI0033F53A95
MPEVLEILALACTGLYAGYMLAFMSGVMPALKEVDDASFTLVMRTVNRRVPGPLFLVLFLGSLAFPVASFFVEPDGRAGGGTALVGVAAVCALVGHLVTSGGNVPLNNALDSSKGRGDERSARTAFEGRWNALHALRTLLAAAAFVLVAVAVTG